MLGGSSIPKSFYYEARESFLAKVDVRVHQVTEEATALVETWDERMREYVRTRKSPLMILGLLGNRNSIYRIFTWTTQSKPTRTK